MTVPIAATLSSVPLRSSAPARWRARPHVALAIIATLALRLAAVAALRQVPDSDGVSYLTMAAAMAHGAAPIDQFGNHAFFSIGYPVLLAPVFALVGAGEAATIAVNLALAALCCWLVVRITRALGGGGLAQTLAGLGYAAWLPGIWSATLPARENLSTPLVAGFVLALLQLAGERPRRAAVAAGLCYGAGLLAGTSVVLTLAGLAVALVRLPDWRARIGCAVIAGAAALIVVAPWLLATDRMLGRPLLTTNAGFNLYIGNNPAATGRFVSMRDTPLGPVWHERYAALGEVGATDWLGQEARGYALSHAGRTVLLGVRKLALFWAPNWPDRADLAASRAVTAVRLAEVAEYLLIVVLAIAALVWRRVAWRDAWLLAATIGGFWLVHTAAYIIPRYRDPVVPLLIALAALGVAATVERTRHAR